MIPPMNDEQKKLLKAFKDWMSTPTSNQRLTKLADLMTDYELRARITKLTAPAIK